MGQRVNLARELAELCISLHSYKNKQSNGEPAVDTLVETFDADNVAGLMEILSCIHGNIERARSQILELVPDSFDNGPALNSLNQITEALSPQRLAQSWHNNGLNHINLERMGPLHSISAVLQREYPTTRLDKEEIEALGVEAQNLLTWLELHQLTDHTVQRLLMISGLKAFQRRLKWFRWVGSEYTYEPLLQFLGSASAIEESPKDSDERAAFLGLAHEFWEKCKKAAGVGAGAYEAGKTLVDAYKDLSTIIHSEAGQKTLLQLTHEVQKLLPGG